ncbi:hypothetical protein VTJ49DRAFT_5202 [Mycothermus thermophilus]|uniref:Armadillo-like helical domain-containing protein n=1 Tax=Humicola insolens TaxID=85995 RepID=A0ABR3VL13_HUMIN
MEPSPLTHQPRPEVFQPKIVRLYEALFKDDSDETERSEGFWKEFFLLRPDRTSLRKILDDIDPNELLQLQHQTRQLFVRAVAALRNPFGVADLHALDVRHANFAGTLSVFMASVLGKKYTNPSSDIIELLAGLDRIDTVFADFVAALESLIRAGRSSSNECCPNGIGHAGQTEAQGNRTAAQCTYTTDLQQRAVEVALAVASGAYQTSLLSYFMQRDLFPAIINDDRRIAHPIANDITTSIFTALVPNYNKFEFQNPYQMRLNDFVNERVIRSIVRGVGQTCQRLRTQYTDVQDDLPEGWTLAATLSRIGLGAIAPGGKPPPKPAFDAETAKRMFAELPGQEAAVLVSTYDFTHANKLFSLEFVTWTPTEPKGQETPFASFISLTSYLLQHAHLSQRTTLYSHLNLMVFRLLVEDPVLCRRMSSDESKTSVRLCRQRSPYLPLVRGERVLATAVMDVMVDAINHNLRRRLDVGLYALCAGILLRVVGFLSRSRTRLTYHWNELFRALLSLVRFLTTYAADLRGLPRVETVLDLVVNLLALGLSQGETFLPTPAAYDDLFYKVVESGEVLVKFRDTWGLANRQSNSIETLVKVSQHYKEMLVEGKGGGDGGGGGGGGGKTGKPSQLTSLQVAEVIKQGYETLSIQAKEGLDSWERYREADERTLLKKVAREAVGDVKGLVAG